MTIYYIVLSTLLTVCLSQPPAYKYLRDTEAGTISLSTTGIEDQTTYFYPRYTINYAKTFTNVPKLAFAIHTLQNCPGTYQNAQLYQTNAGSTVSQFVLVGRIYVFYGYDPKMKMKLNYFAVDNITRTQFIVFTMWYNVAGNTYNSSAIYTGVNLTYSSATIRWYFSSVFGPFPTSSFQIYNTYSIDSGNRYYIYLYFTINATVYSVLSLQITTSVIIYIPSIEVFPNWGSLTSLTSSISYNQTQISSSSFIGLIGITSTNRCLKISLTDTNKIDSSSLFSSVVYQSFRFWETYISLTKSYPFTSKVNFYFQQLNTYSINSTYSGTFTTTLTPSSYSAGIFSANVIAPIPTTPVSMKFNMYNSSTSFLKRFSFKIITAKSLTIDAAAYKCDVVLINIDETVDLDNFQLSDSNFSFNQIQQTSIVKLEIAFTASDVAIPFDVKYTSIDTYTNASVQLNILKFNTKLWTSATSTQTTLQVCNLTSVTIIYPLLIWTSNNLMNQGLNLAESNSVIQGDFDYLSNAQTTPITFGYTRNPSVSNFQVGFSLNLLTVKSIQIDMNSSILKIVYINIDDSSQAAISQFTLNVSNVVLTTLGETNDQLVIQAQYTDTIPFSITYSPSSFPIQATTTDLKIAKRFSSFSYSVGDHCITFIFDNVETITVLPIVTFPASYLSLFKSQIVGSSVIIYTNYSKTLSKGQRISINYDINESTIYYDIITLAPLEQPIFYCLSAFKIQSQNYERLSYVVVASYWINFVVSMFFCQKIVAIEMLFILQFAYTSLIPMGINCPPFSSLSPLKYAYGWNGISFNVEEANINYSYSSIGIQANFVSNVNAMMFPLFVCPVIYGILTLLGKLATHYKRKPRLLVYGKTFLLDVPLTIILVNAPNICTSFVVSLQAFGKTNIQSLALSILGITLISLAVMLFLIFRKSFLEYNNEFCTSLEIFGWFSIKTSTKMRKLYPLLLMFQIVSISTILAMQSLSNISLYLSLGIMIFVGIFNFVLTPYAYSLNNIRLLVHQLLLIIICCLQIGFKSMKQNTTSLTLNSFVFDYPMITLVMLFLISVFYIPFLIIFYIKWVKSRDIIDFKLFIEQKGIKQPSYQSPVPVPYMPIRQFIQNRHKNMNQVQSPVQVQLQVQGQI